MRRPPTLQEVTYCALAALLVLGTLALAFRGSQAAEGGVVLALGTAMSFLFRGKTVPPSGSG